MAHRYRLVRPLVFLAGRIQGYNGTDTAFFRYDPYHTRKDTPEKIGYDRLARVTKGLAEVVIELANTEKLQ